MSIRCWDSRDRSKRVAMAIALACVILAWGRLLAAAEPVKIDVLPGDLPLELRGRAGADLVKRIGLIAPSAPVPEVVFRSTDLKREDGAEVIPRQQIAPSSATFSLAKNTPKDFELKVTGVKVPGKYQGKLHFLQPDQGMTGLTVDITVNVEGVAKLILRKGSESVKIQRVNCTLACGLARWFQPGAFAATYPLQFDNGSLGPFMLTGSVAGIGDVTRHSLEKTLALQLGPQPVPTSPVYAASLSINAKEKLSADHYVGDLQLRFAGEETALKIPLEVNVRSGLVPAIVVLLVGILLGRLVKYMKDKGVPQSDLLLAAYRLETQIAASPPDQSILQPMLEDVKGEIYAMKLEQAKRDLEAVEKRWMVLSTLGRLARRLHRDGDNAGVQPILDDIAKARRLVEIKKDQDAVTLLTQIETAVENLSTPSAKFSEALVHARRARVAADRAVRVSQPGKLGTVQRAISLVTGVSGERAEFTLWVIRPLLYVLLIIGVLAVGLQQLYWKNATFGSDPFSDYFGLLVWAMSADVASRTLSALKTGS